MLWSPLAPLGVLAARIAEQKEAQEIQLASYLQTLMDLSLDQNEYPEIKKHLSRREIEEVGAALNVRYNPGGSFAGAFISRNRRFHFYDALRATREGQVSRQMGDLVRMANEQGLVVVPLGSRFAMLFYEKENLSPKSHWRGAVLDVDDPREVEKLISDVTYQPGQLVPVGLFALDVGLQPLELVSFAQPYEQAARMRIAQTVKEAKRMLFAFIPFGAARIAVTATDGVIRFSMKKKGKTLFEDRVRSYGELAAVLETGVARFSKDESESILFDAFLKYAPLWGFDSKRILDYEKRFHTQDEKTRLSARAEVIELFAKAEMRRSTRPFQRATTEDEIERTKTIHMQRLGLWLESSRSMRKLDEKLTKRAREGRERSPATSAAATSARPVILFMVDGLRPDRLRWAAEQGWIPRLKELFVDGGAEVESYVSRSLTLPSWGTVLTGHEPDRHGIRSNTPITRDSGGRSVSLLDARKDLLWPEYIAQGMAYRLLAQSQPQWLPRYFSRSEVILNYLPIHENQYPPVLGLLGGVLRNVPEALQGTLSGTMLLDQVSADRTAAAIRSKPGQTKLVVNWYASVDHFQHLNNDRLKEVMALIDSGIGSVIDAARADPVLKDAVVFLVSDHGHLGGSIEEKPGSMLGQKKLNNTAFNLTTWFAGDFPAGNTNDFVVLSDASPNPTRDFGYLREFQIHPFSYVYRGHKKTPGPVTVAIDSSGDRLAQFYLFRGNQDRKTHGLYGLTHFKDSRGQTRDLIDQILSARLRNLEITDFALRDQIRQRTGMRPVEFAALALRGSVARESLDRLVRADLVGASERDPVLVRSFGGKSAVILTKRSPVTGEDLFRYVVLRSFDQDARGECRGEISTNVSDDPLALIGNVPKAEAYLEWRTDREWLEAGKKSSMPIVVFGLIRALTLDPGIPNLPAREAEIPDLILSAAFGFNFNSSDHQESDHGAFSAEEARNSFFVRGLGSRDGLRRGRVGVTALSRDVLPTVLDFAGLYEADAFERQGLTGDSLRLQLER
jgi:hypothetical protein